MLLINETEYALPDVKFGNLYEKEIVIQNPTHNTVTINDIGSACTCTTGYIVKNPLPPETNTVAKISFNSNKLGKGDYVKSYTISWNANGISKSQKIKFTVKIV